VGPQTGSSSSSSSSSPGGAGLCGAPAGCRPRCSVCRLRPGGQLLLLLLGSRRQLLLSLGQLGLGLHQLLPQPLLLAGRLPRPPLRGLELRLGLARLAPGLRRLRRQLRVGSPAAWQQQWSR
jgi:hypothetical protein